MLSSVKAAVPEFSPGSWRNGGLDWRALLNILDRSSAALHVARRSARYQAASLALGTGMPGRRVVPAIVQTQG
jgi:hypothetical protein